MIHRVRIGVACSILAGWLFTIIAPAFLDDFKPNLAVNGPLLFVLAWLFPPAKRAFPRRNKTQDGEQ